jgi:hypothetical protein
MSKLEDLYATSTGKFKTIVTNKDETPYSKGGSSPAANTKDDKGVTVSDTTFGDIDIKTDEKERFTQKTLDAARGGTIGQLPATKIVANFITTPYAPGDKSYSKVVKR